MACGHCPQRSSPSPCLPDHDECQDMVCENGECVNTEGSFHCFCSPPLTLDLSQQRCVNSTSGVGQWGWGVGGRSRGSGPGMGRLTCPVPPEDLPDHDIHMDICWKRVTNYVCSHPLHGRRTTYTECCCQDGEAWSQQCALCPPRSSGEKAGMPQSWAPREGMSSPWKGAGASERSRASHGPAFPPSCLGMDAVGQSGVRGEEHRQELGAVVPAPPSVLESRNSTPGLSSQEPGPSFLSPSCSLQRSTLSSATWPGSKPSGRLGSTSGLAMSTAPGPMTCTIASTAQTGSPSTTTWAPRTPSPSHSSPARPAAQGTAYRSLNLPCSPQNSSPTMWPATQVCVAAKTGKRWALKRFHFHLLHLLITVSRVRTGKGKIHLALSRVTQGTGANNPL